MHDGIFYYEPKCVLRAYNRITTVVKIPNSYYVFTTIDGINMPRFAISVTFLTNLTEISNLANHTKTRQIEAF